MAPIKAVIDSISVYYSIYFLAMLLQALKDLGIGVHIRFRTDSNLLNLQRLKAHTKVTEQLLSELLFVDDMQLIFDCFAKAGHTISL